MAGRKKSFKKFLQEELQYLLSTDGFRMSSFCKNMNFTALPYFHVYYHYYCNGRKLETNLDKKFIDKIRTISLPDTPAELANLPWKTHNEYIKIWQLYSYYLNSSSANSDLKKTYFTSISKKLADSPLSKKELCSSLKISKGNLSSFLRGDLSKLSIEKCRALSSALKADSKQETQSKPNTLYKPVYNDDGEIIEWVTLKEIRRRNLEQLAKK